MAYSTVISFQHTATSDDLFRLTNDDIRFSDANFYVSTNAALFGSSVINEAPASAGSAFWFRNGNLRDFWFKNAVAGNNTTITVVATLAEGA